MIFVMRGMGRGWEIMWRLGEVKRVGRCQVGYELMIMIKCCAL